MEVLLFLGEASKTEVSSGGALDWSRPACMITPLNGGRIGGEHHGKSYPAGEPRREQARIVDMINVALASAETGVST